MKSNFRKVNKGWILGVFVLFFGVFLVVTGYRTQFASKAAGEAATASYDILDEEGNPTGGTYELRRSTAMFSMSGRVAGDNFKWESLSPEVMTVSSGADSQTVTVNVVNIGSAGLLCTITHADGSSETRTVTINVVFSINEFLSSSSTAKMAKIFDSSERRSIIMSYDNPSLYFSKSAADDNSRLNLIFGDATSENAVWTSNNEDVIRVVKDETGSKIVAVGAGKTQLSVVYRDGANEYEDSIDVYVRPELRKESSTGTLLGSPSSSSSSAASGGAFTMKDNDKVWLPALFSAQPLEGILDKVTWVIAKRSGTSRTLVRDSLGNKGANGDDVNLVWDGETFRLDAKAGQYVVMFYVKGTYTSFDEAQNTDIYKGCDPVYFNADVDSSFEDKNVTISIDGSYNLSDAFNISLSSLKDNFSITNMENSGNWISADFAQWIMTGVTQGGTATFKVRCNKRPSETIPGISEGDEVTVKITVTDTFALNVSSATMAVGSKLDLTGIIGSGVYTDGSSFEWESSDTKETYVSVSSSAQYATVTAKKETGETPVTVTLKWTDDYAITRVASCKIYVNTSATTIALDRTSLEMEIGSVDYLDSGLRGEQNLTWMSADTDIVTVEPQQGNTQAKLTAGKKTGSTVVTVLNKDNNVYATCRVTVTAAISELSIVQGENLDTYLSAGFVFLKVNYKPTNATSTDLVWSTSDKSVATVDENGVVTLLKEDTVWISVEPKFNPYSVVARCCINIKKNPVTDIITDVDEIDMIAGDQYTVDTTIVPADATDATLQWNTDSDKIAKVEGGVITAVAPGDANITVANGSVFKIIKVHVRNRLLSVSFSENTYEIKEGSTISLRDAVTFNPSEYVNENLSWASSNSDVVSVDEDGNITGLRAGEQATITCVPEDIGVMGAITCTVKVISQDIRATDVELTPTEATMHVGEQMQISAIFTPITATYQNMSWSSTDEDIATVDKNGLVTAVAEGTVSIGAVYRDPFDNTVWDPIYCKITVEPAPVSAVSYELKPAHKEIIVGDTYTLEAVFTPADTTNQDVTFYSSNEAVATIDNDGLVTGVAVGEAVLIGRSDDGAMVATATVTVVRAPILVEDFTIEPSAAEVEVGSTFYINPVFTPVDADNQNVTYQSADATIATVDEYGLVTGVSVGKTTIICQSEEGNINAVCNVTVIKPFVAVINFNITPIEQDVETGSTFQITAVFTPSEATNQKVTYQSSDTGVATVDENGLVTGVTKGDTTIICQSDEGKIVVYCNVHVFEGVTLSLKPASREIALGKTFTIKKVIDPEEADSAAVWTSTNPTVATVTDSGKVKGVKKGSCTIVCTLTKYNVTAECEVTVATLRTTVSISKASIRMGKGSTYTLSAKVWSNNTKTPAVRWKTSKKKIASITQKGKIKAKKVGKTVITAVSRDKLKVKASCKVRVIQRATGLQIEPNYATCYVGGTKHLTAVAKPKTTSIKKVTWKSEDTSIATVESNGLVRGIAEGSTKITATTTDGSKKTATCYLKVTEKVPVTSIVVAQTALTMKKGDSSKLSYTLLPNNTSDDISFASDNNRVAKVSANGTVKAMGTGTCTITILSDGGVSSTVAVNVVALNRTSLSLRQYDTETLEVEGTSDTISWYSGNSRIATVENGTVVGRSVGSTYIYATVNGCKMACKVTVTKIQ